MSAVVTARVQVGQSGTPGNNITIETPAVPDGSFKIRKGAHDGSGAVLFQVDAAGNPTFPTQAPRTWQNVTGSRTLTTTYTNNTGRDMQIIVASSANALSVVVDGLIIAPPVNANSCAYVTVPAGSTYSVPSTNSPTLSSWYELRP